MDLLAKFEAVEIRQDTRISAADRAFCEAHQAAYENAKSSLQELEYFWDDMLKQQDKLLTPAGASPSIYLLSHSSLKISGDAIRQQIRELHSLFITQLVSHFSRTYHFSISTENVKEKLLPQEPPNRWDDNYKEAVQKYGQDMLDLTLHHGDVLEQLFLQTGGRAFAGQALHELKENCRRAAWNPTTKCAKYTQKKCTVQFTGYYCSYRTYYSGGDSWSLSDSMKDIMKGIAHFETEGFSDIPHAVSRLMNGHDLDSNEHDFTGCQKVVSLKMFKNSRVDVKFATESLTRQFIDEYLGSIYPCG